MCEQSVEITNLRIYILFIVAINWENIMVLSRNALQ